MFQHHSRKVAKKLWMNTLVRALDGNAFPFLLPVHITHWRQLCSSLQISTCSRTHVRAQCLIVIIFFLPNRLSTLFVCSSVRVQPETGTCIRNRDSGKTHTPKRREHPKFATTLLLKLCKEFHVHILKNSNPVQESSSTHRADHS
jgi:hypothetical protein